MVDYTWIESVIAAYNYNRDTKSVISTIQGVINRLLDKPYLETNAGDNGTDILMSAIVIQYGEYGTSPRYGWLYSEHFRNVLHILREQLSYYKSISEHEEV